MKKLLILLGIIITFPFQIHAQISKTDQQKIDKLFQEWNENTPGSAIGIIQNGKLIYTKGYGSANLDYQIPISADSRFYIASIAKQFTAACIALLSMEGKLSLDDDIRKYVPEVPDYGEVITINHLVRHTNGLRDYLSLRYLSGRSFEDYFNNQDGIHSIAKQKALNFSPNEEFLYTNSGYILLAEIVNRVSGMTLREYADKHIFQPLGMINTFFNDDHTQVTKNRVVSYRKEGDNTFKRYVQNFDGHGDGGMISTINDLYLWDQNFYHKKVGGEKFIDLMLSQRALNNGYIPHYAFGLEHGQYNGLKIVVHGGNFLGFNHHFTRFPEQQTSIIVLSNIADINPYYITDEISDILLAGQFIETENDQQSKVEKTPPTFIELDQTQLQKYSAYYWNDQDNYSRKIYLKNDTLRYARNENNESLMVPIGNHKFKMLVRSDITVAFDLVDDLAQKMSVTVNDRDPIEFRRYKPASYTPQKLEAIAGSYFSSELDCEYELRMKEGALFLYINDKEYSVLDPIMGNMFMNDFVGVILFQGEAKKEFIIKSNRVRGIVFTKI